MTPVTATGTLAVGREQVLAALAGVQDPEIHRPVTELGMVGELELTDTGAGTLVGVEILLTTSGCPLRDTLLREVSGAVLRVPGVADVRVRFGAMDADQRAALQELLRGGRPVKQIPFAGPDSLTRVIAVASGKGGVGKSSVTAGLALALTARGLTVGILDADIYGHSIPRLMGLSGRHPTVIERMILPLEAHGIRVVSTAMFKPDTDDVVAWRGPMLDRALTQYLTDVHWGDLDVLLLDLPPGTGDVAISVAQRLPTAQILVVTTPQQAAAEVAERSGTLALQTRQRVAGVVENMSWLACPHCGERTDVFGSGGGARVAGALSGRLGYDVPLLAEIPLQVGVRQGGDAGDAAAAFSDPTVAGPLAEVATALTRAGRGLVGRPLGLSPVAR